MSYIPIRVAQASVPIMAVIPKIAEFLSHQKRQGAPTRAQQIFLSVGIAGGFLTGFHLIGDFQHRFEPPGTRILGWHVWVWGVLYVGSATTGAVVGLMAHHVLFRLHQRH